MHNFAHALLGAASAYLVVVAAGPLTIEFLRRLCRERIDSPSPVLASLHAAKSGTPSMGGLLVFAAWLSAITLSCDLRQIAVQTAIAAALAFAALGACDDLIKARGRRRGLSACAKLMGQMGVSAAAVAAAAGNGESSGPMGWLLYLPLASAFVAGMSNAVNVTDGLDGLAAGCGAVAAAALASAALLLPAANLADAEQHRQLGLLAASLAGALAGFLRFNRSPARVFMGDTGSLPLGGLLALLAIWLRCELLLLVVGGVFVAELASVVLQVACFRRTGRRLFRCAPLHHHFEFLGWPERAIVRRFWAAATGLATAGLLLNYVCRPRAG